ncbi:hypothetical protein EYF80_045241 [Liparis tanakae]|uniref:Uncharacterized protein n=1 Tax=Liparis tanakae TaxID=230148 RepID=A0A4Z2FTH1_9TELE|nr:hypothetical protein EYF80_045241 [Liparis tanakae]
MNTGLAPPTRGRPDGGPTEARRRPDGAELLGDSRRGEKGRRREDELRNARAERNIPQGIIKFSRTHPLGTVNV